MNKKLSEKLSDLEKLTRAREQAALAKLAEVASRKRAAEQAVEELKATAQQATSIHEAKLLGTWLQWRQQELAKCNMRLSAIVAEYQITARECGLFVAEQAVVENLRVDAKREEYMLSQRRQMFTSPDGLCP